MEGQRKRDKNEGGYMCQSFLSVEFERKGKDSERRRGMEKLRVK